MMFLWVTVVAAAVGCLGHALALPLQHEGGGGEKAWSGRQYMEAGLGVAALLTSVTTLLACACCKRSKGFQELGSVSSRVAGSSSTLTQAPREEITLFPPPGLSVSTTQINFEPLPDIRPRPSALGHARPATDKTMPPFFTGRAPASPTASVDTPTDEWFAHPHQNFPRNQLQYVRELGRGWFGQVLEGRAAGVFSDHTKGESPVGTAVGSSGGLTPVAVKVLREDASPSEQQYFLQELKPYRDLTHPNVLRVLAHCLEAEPFLILLQLCPRGDLKTVLRNDKTLSEATLLRMTLDVASGLKHMHAHNYIHTDLAARNCVVEEDNMVKIGDYGFSIDSYKDEYYCAGDIALPLRWCSPETLKCTDITIETKEVTKAANVWSFGVVMWEVTSRGDLPYSHLDHEEVIQKVIMEQTTQLDLPPNLHLHPTKLYNIMRQCWEGEESRPSMAHTHTLLAHLWEHAASTPEHDNTSLGDFEHRWNELRLQDSRDHNIINLANTSSLRFESDFNLSSALEPHPLGEALSPSLQNLHGSAEDLDARIEAKLKPLPSWLGVEPGQPIDSLTQEITDAILKLDDYLAGEKSEPSTGEASPEKCGVNFRLGKDSFVSNPPESAVARMGGVSLEDARGHLSLQGALTEEEDEEEGFSMRLEQGAFSEMVRLKSQSVQDFMRLTVVDDASDSDTASQRNSLGLEPLTQEKTFSSEGNIREALRDDKFMGELQRLQAEHRYSIITEASKECASSIEYRDGELGGDGGTREDCAPHHRDDAQRGSTDRLLAAESDGSDDSNDGTTGERDPFLCEVFSSDPAGERAKTTSESREGTDDHPEGDAVQTKPLPASPDCVVSSREPKPATLPDIVVHNGGSSLAQSSPSPPTSPSALAHLRSSQRKEFRFVFGGEGAEGPGTTGGDVPDGAGGRSVVFSENITEEEQQEEGKGVAEKKGVSVNAGAEGDSITTAERVTRANHVDPFSCRSDSRFAPSKKPFGLTSTLLQPPRTGTAAKSESRKAESASGEFVDLGTPFGTAGDLNDTDLNDTDLKNASLSEQVKQRLVFGPSDGENENKDDNGENDGVPNYLPEEIVKGEEVVIGAQEVYSLELYKAVKSSEDLPETPGTSAEGQDSKVNTETSGIQFDLVQWDQFLGKTLSRENSCCDPVFSEGPMGNEDVMCDAVNDTIGLTFGSDPNSTSVSRKTASDSVSPVFHSAQEEVSSSSTSNSNTPAAAARKPECSSKADTRADTRTHPDVAEVTRNPERSLNGHGNASQNSSYHTPDSLTKDPFPVHTPSTAEEVVTGSFPSSATWGDLDTSPAFSYKKEAPVDSSFECLTETSANVKLDVGKGLIGLSENTSVEVISPLVMLQDSLRSPHGDVDNLLASGDGDAVVNSRSTSANVKLDVGKDVIGPLENTSVEAVSPLVMPQDSLRSPHTDVEEEKWPHNLLLSGGGGAVVNSSSSGVNGLGSDEGVRSALRLVSSGSVIIKGEDDLSPSAYQGSWSGQGGQEGAPESDEVENGDFWEQQMMAWQAAAFQTRQLLQQATGQGVHGAAEGRTNAREEASPRSDASSSPKSLYSSTDLLNLDDEGTYVSYNTTDEEEVLGYRPEDISALRAELSLKLDTGQGEAQEREPEEPEDPAALDRETVVINYRGIISSTLSPIKEESFLEEDEAPGRRGSRGNAVEGGDSVLDCSIEFEEPSGSESETKANSTFVIDSNKQPSILTQAEIDAAAGDTSGCVEQGTAGEALVTSLENAHDSLILEDLDEEDGPASIQIYNSGTSLDAEDILVVDTETNEAKILDQGKPRSHLAFVVDREQPPETSPLHPFGFEDTDDVAPESIPSEEGRRLFQQQQQRKEQVASSKPSREQTGSSEQKSTPEFLLSNEDVSDSPRGIQVPAYHSYFTSALSSISHPNTSLEEPPLYEQVEQISLPYEVNYPPPTALQEDEDEEELHSLEDVQQQQQGDAGNCSHNISEIEDDEDAAPIKLSFLGRLYSDEDKEEQQKKPKTEREATLLSDSDGEETPTKPSTLERAKEADRLKQMTSAEFLASEKFKTDDSEVVEEQLTTEVDSEEDSEDEHSPRGSPKKGEGSPAAQESRYTPDWESESDSDDDSSSTSGEFMWKPGEPCQPAPYILDIIEEEPHEDEERDEGELSEDSESGEEEFTPSQWNSDLTPSHSLLKSPQNKSSLKKTVHWKRQRHHRVYEYPPEPRSWEHAFTEPQYRRSWGRSSLDYLSLADWELGADEFIDESEDMEDFVYHKPTRPAPPPPIYSLGSMTYDDAAEGFLVDNGEFFIRSSGSPFTFTRSSFSASDFFPGGHSSDYDVIFGSAPQAPTPSVPYTNCKASESVQEPEEQETYSSKPETQYEEDPQAANLTQEECEQQGGSGASLGQLRHTRDKLRLEIPSLNLTSDKGSSGGLENGRSALECSEPSYVIMNHGRVEPEVSEV